MLNLEYLLCCRVARVCKKDTGGKNILNQNWATYVKARLNCSIPGEFPFYFNEIRKYNVTKTFCKACSLFIVYFKYNRDDFNVIKLNISVTW